MKTTSILTITGVLSLGLMTLLNFQGHGHRAGKHLTHAPVMVSEPLNEDIFYMNIAKSADVASEGRQSADINFIPANVCEDELNGTQDLCLDAIVFIEAEEPIDLGFDTSEYLPAGFNPYVTESNELDLNSIVFLEDTDDADLGFDTAEYLPIGFNAYEGMEPDLNEIVFIEDAEPIELGFDTSKYLPEGFDPYARPALQLDEIIFLEPESTVDLGFDVDTYLPADFDPYAAPEFDIDQIPFMEAEEEIQLLQDAGTPASETAFNL
jgi:hypothetical protein